MDKGAMGPKGQDWRDIRCDMEEFRQRCSTLGVPPHLVDAIGESLMAEPSEEDAAWGQSLLTPVSFESFSEAIDRTKRDSAGGMSGLTYNMMRCWSVKTRKSIYEMLVECWTKGTVPDYWRWRWLVPIPKKADPELHELRRRSCYLRA
jgi:hypothetical protein